MQDAKFVIVSHPTLHTFGDTGQSFGLLFVEQKNLIYLSVPIERGRINAVQTISGIMLHTFLESRMRDITDEDRNIMKGLETWAVSVKIPDEFFDHKDTPVEYWNRLFLVEDICMFLRCSMTGIDNDPNVYEVPDDLGEMDFDSTSKSRIKV